MDKFTSVSSNEHKENVVQLVLIHVTESSEVFQQALEIAKEETEKLYFNCR